MNARIAVLISLAGCSTLPRPGDIRIPSFDLHMRDAQLPSGMRVIAQRDEHTAHVAIVAVVGVGSSQDPRGKEGLAHLVEHLAFRAEAEPGLPMWRQLAREAAEWNAFTTHDATVYHQVVHRQLFERAFERDVKRLLDPLRGVDAASFDVEREVVRNELRLRGEIRVEGAIYHSLLRMLFPPDHPYARPPIGSHESLSSLTLEDAEAFAARWYRPENVTLVIAGDVDLSSIDQFLDRHLTPEALGDRRRARDMRARVTERRLEPPATPQPTSAQVTAPNTRMAGPEIWIGWTLPGDFREGSTFESAFLERVLAVTLELYVEGEVEGVLDSTVSRVPGAEGGFVIARLFLSHEADATETTERTLARVHELWRAFGNDADYKRKVRNDIYRSVLARQILSAESLYERAIDTALFTHFAGRPTFYGEFISSMQRLTSKRLEKLASTYLDRSRARILQVLPSREPPPDEAPPSIGLGVRERGSGDYDWQPPQLNDTFAASSTSVSFTLENGLRVSIDPRRSLLSTTVALVIFGGARSEARAGEALVADAVLWPRFTRGWPVDFGATIEHRLSRDHETWLVHAPSGNLENAIAMISDVAERLEIYDQRWKRFQRKIPRLERESDLPAQRAAQRFERELGDEGMRGTSVPVQSLAAIERDDVTDRVERLYRPANAVLLVAGAGAAEAERCVRSWLSDWEGDPGESAVLRRREIATHEGPRYLLTDHPSATQVEIRAACQLSGVDVVHEDVVARVAGMRLQQRLRNDLGATYHVESVPVRWVDGARLSIEMHVETARFDRALQSLAAELDRWADGSAADQQAIDRTAFLLARDQAWRSESSYARVVETASAIGLRLPAHRAGAVREVEVDRLFGECRRGMVISLQGPLEPLRRAIPSGWARALHSD